MNTRGEPLPGDHVLRAALRTGQLIDEYGSSVERARASYVVYASDALYPPHDLREGEALLLSLGLLIEDQGVLRLTEALQQLVRLDSPSESLPALVDLVVDKAVRADKEGAASIADLERYLQDHVPDPQCREERLLQLASKYDVARNAETGAIGEERVVQLAKDKLIEIGRPDLARLVRRVSSISDALGYDVVMPRVDGRLRLEVKTTSIVPSTHFRFLISRNEATCGQRDPDWRLVACVVTDGGAEVVGYCSASAIVDHLPSDADGGRWASAEVRLPLERLQPGMPSPI